jgi:hypothetical protein
MATNVTTESATPITGARTSSVLARFTAAPGVTTEQYDETLRRLEPAGNWPPDGLAYHVAFRSDGRLRVSEIWDSRAQMDTFGERLMPVLKDVGIELSGEPEVVEIHNIIER